MASEVEIGDIGPEVVHTNGNGRPAHASAELAVRLAFIQEQLNNAHGALAKRIGEAQGNRTALEMIIAEGQLRAELAEKLERELNSLKVRLETLTQDNNAEKVEERDAFLAEVQALRKKIESLTEAHAQKITEMLAQIESLEAKLVDSSLGHSELLKTAERLNEENTTLLSKVETLTRRIARLERLKAESEEKSDVLLQERDSLVRDQAELFAGSQSLSEQLGKMRSELERVTEALKGSEGLADEVDELEARLEELQSQLADLNIQKEQNESELQAVRCERDEREVEIAEARSANVELLAQFEALRSSKTAEQADLETELGCLRENVASLSERICELTAELEEIEAQKGTEKQSVIVHDDYKIPDLSLKKLPRTVEQIVLFLLTCEAFKYEAQNGSASGEMRKIIDGNNVITESEWGNAIKILKDHNIIVIEKVRSKRIKSYTLDPLAIGRISQATFLTLRLKERIQNTLGGEQIEKIELLNRISQIEQALSELVKQKDTLESALEGKNRQISQLEREIESSLQTQVAETQEKPSEQAVSQACPATLEINGEKVIIKDVEEYIENLRAKISEWRTTATTREKDLNKALSVIDEIRAQRDDLQLIVSEKKGKEVSGGSKKVNSLPQRAQILVEIIVNPQLMVYGKDLSAVVAVIAKGVKLEHNEVARSIVGMVSDRTIIIERELRTQKVKLVLSDKAKTTLGIES